LQAIFQKNLLVRGYLREAGFAIEVSMQRAPSVEVEVQTERIYLLARKLPLALIVGSHKE
jgi:hypothetical protein